MNVSSSTTPGVQSTQRPTTVQALRQQEDMRTQSQKPEPAPPSNSSAKNAGPVVNSQGQTTGLLLNATA